MAKYYGMIGFGVDEEIESGRFVPKIEERPYTGDVIRQQRNWQAGEGVNDNLNVSNVISIVADPYAVQHFHSIRYVTWYGAKWKVRSIEVNFPRLNLTIGDVYNEQTVADAPGISGEYSGG